MGDIVDQIDAAIEGRCACGCGAAITDSSPSAYFAREHCHARWMAKQRGLAPPPDTDVAPPFPGRPGAPSTPAPTPAATPTYGLALLLRQGWRYATASQGPLPAVPVPWLRWCDDCRQHVTPVDGMRALPITYDTIANPSAVMEPLELERANICPSCHQPFAGPHLTAMWRPGAHQTYQLALVHGEHIGQTTITHEVVRHAADPRTGLAICWRHVERHLLERLAPRCEHPAGCTSAARNRFHLGATIQYAGTLLYQGRTLVLCGPHGSELQRHVYTSWAAANPSMGISTAAPYHREPLDWARR